MRERAISFAPNTVTRSSAASRIATFNRCPYLVRIRSEFTLIAGIARFPPPWTIEEHAEFFIVRDATGQAPGYFLTRSCSAARRQPSASGSDQMDLHLTEFQ